MFDYTHKVGSVGKVHTLYNNSSQNVLRRFMDNLILEYGNKVFPGFPESLF